MLTSNHIDHRQGRDNLLYQKATGSLVDRILLRSSTTKLNAAERVLGFCQGCWPRPRVLFSQVLDTDTHYTGVTLYYSVVVGDITRHP